MGHESSTIAKWARPRKRKPPCIERKAPFVIRTIETFGHVLSRLALRGSGARAAAARRLQ
jgi:hypothetical protein